MIVVVVLDANLQAECLCQRDLSDGMRISTNPEEEIVQGPSMAKNSSPSRVPKTGAQLQTTWRSAKNAEELPNRRHTHAESIPSLVRTGMSANSGDELKRKMPHIITQDPTRELVEMVSVLREQRVQRLKSKHRLSILLHSAEERTPKSEPTST